jgi:hypothetical protein
MWFSCLYSLAWGIIYILSAYLLVPTYGAAGLAAAFTITRLLTSLPLVAYIYQYEGPFVSNVPLGLLTGAILLLSLICVLVSHLASPIVAGGVGIITACIFAWKVFRQIKSMGIREFNINPDNIR